MSVYAVSDLHGSLPLFKQIQNFMKKDDVLYVLGDCCDRGIEPWLTVKEVAKDSRCIYIKGNHEDMLVEAIRENLRMDDFHYSSLLWANGGLETYEQWDTEEHKMGWYQYLRNLPVYKRYCNKNGFVIHLSHAGFTPFEIENPFENSLIWDRNHVFDVYPSNRPNDIVIHGHTPIPYIIKGFNAYGVKHEKWEGGALWYSNNHKVCIDTGAYSSNEIVLLDLDTFDEHIFQV